jgi:hypothetical protein
LRQPALLFSSVLAAAEQQLQKTVTTIDSSNE